MSPEETKVGLKQNAQADKSIFGTLPHRLFLLFPFGSPKFLTRYRGLRI